MRNALFWCQLGTLCFEGIHRCLLGTLWWFRRARRKWCCEKHDSARYSTKTEGMSEMKVLGVLVEEMPPLVPKPCALEIYSSLMEPIHFLPDPFVSSVEMLWDRQECGVLRTSHTSCMRWPREKVRMGDGMEVEWKMLMVERRQQCGVCMADCFFMAWLCTSPEEVRPVLDQCVERHGKVNKSHGHGA